MSAVPRLSPRSSWRRALLGAAIGLALALLLGLLRGTDLFTSIELRLVDARTRHFASEREPDADIVIVQIEEADIAEVRRKLGVRWPWPLEYNAHLVRVIDEAGAKALMVDILHLDRGAGPDDVPDSDNLPDAERQMREGEAYSAEEYGAALRDFGKAIVAFELSSRTVFDVPARRKAAEERLGTAAPSSDGSGLALPHAELPVRRVAEGAAALGFVNVDADQDGVVRRAALVGTWGGRAVRSLPLATAELVADAERRVLPALRRRSSMLINFHDRGPRGGYARVAPTQLLEWALHREQDGTLFPAAREALEDKIVILGVNAAGLKDVVPSPLGVMDGPVFQAIALDNLLHGDSRTRAPLLVDPLILLLLLVAAGALGGGLRGKLTHALPILLAAPLVFFAYARFGAGTSHDLFTPLLGLVLTWGGTSVQRALTEGRRNAWLEGTFGRYMAPSVIQALKDDPTLLELGGRDRHVTVLFSDIAGFTSLSEHLEPAQVVALLNRYLTSHCAAVLDDGGVVDKFLGDGVMAFFGDPVPQPDHPLRACRSALRVQQELPRLAPTLKALGLEKLTVRIGIHTGRAVVGNIGSEQRFDYTCMGDTANLASRLEGASKVFGIEILIGPETAEAVKNDMLLKPLGGIVVVGREDPVAVYELVGARAGASEERRAHVEAFGRAVEAARRGARSEAEQALAEADRLAPGDGPVAWFQDVLAGLAPDQTWDGVTTLESK